jgi:gluconate 2-dehydrogenase gamma chain
MPTRREALKSIVTAAGASSVALPVLDGQQAHQHKSEEPAQAAIPRKLKFLTGAEFQTVSQVAERIIPRTDTPGAIEVGVPELIDESLDGRPERIQQGFRKGLASLDEASRRRYKSAFAALEESRQNQLLTRLSKDSKTEAGRFFQVIRDLTIDSYYSTREGLTQELGWHGNTYLPEFAACNHPEHQG